MKILYITTPNPRAQGDFQENIILHGLRSLIGSDVVDLPRKKVMYGFFSWLCFFIKFSKRIDSIKGLRTKKNNKGNDQ